MKRKSSFRRMISFLLACIMIMNLPLSALATDDFQFQEAEILEEDVVSEDFDEISLDSSSSDGLISVEDVSVLDEAGENENTETTGDSEIPAEGNLEDFDSAHETGTPEQGTVSVLEDEDNFILGIEEVDSLDSMAFGEDGDVTPADSVNVSVTISNAGNLVMMKKDITVTDYDKDGNLDVDDALYAAHEAAYTGGADAGYACETTEDGLSLTKLWGNDSGAFGYWVNDSSCNSLADPIKANDNLVAYVYKDTSDSYTKFGQTEYTVTAGEALTVSVETAGWDNEQFKYTFSSCEGAVLTAYDSNKNTLSTDAYSVNGYQVTFKNSGTYYLSASGTDSMNLVPAVVKVTVEEKTNPEITITLSKTEASVLEGGQVNLTASVSPENAADDLTVDWSSSDETVAKVSSKGNTGYVNGISVGTAVVTASIGNVQATCNITVTPGPKFSDLALYIDLTSYNNGESPLKITPEFNGDTYDGYSVVAPDYLTSLYAVATLSEDTVERNDYRSVMFSNSWGGWTGGTVQNGIAKASAYFASKGYLDIYFTNASSRKYKVNVQQYATLKDLTIDGVVNKSFNRDLTTYHAYVDSTKDGVDITSIPFKTGYTVTVNGNTVTGGETYHLLYNWNENDKMDVTISVGKEGLVPTAYTVELEKMPRNDTPSIMTQPVGGDYIKGNSTKALSVVASSNGEMSYQWYVNTVDNIEGGIAIDGATEASYTPSSETVGTFYYYCVITNTGKEANNTASSNTACVVIDPDPTPIATLINPGEELPDDGYDYDWHKGYVYQVGDEASPLEVTATSAAEGGTYAYQWFRLNRPYDGSGASCGTEITCTPDTALSRANSIGYYYACRVTYTFKGKNYSSWATTGETVTVNDISRDVEGVYVFLKVTSAAVPEITTQPVSASYLEGDKATALQVYAKKADGGTLSYQWYENTVDSKKGATLIESATSSRYTPSTEADAGTKYYYCAVTNTIQNYSYTVNSEIAQITVTSLSELIGDKMVGSGTAEEPYLIADAQAYQTVAELVAQGVSFEGKYLKQTADITLPDGWNPIGVTKDGSNNIQSGRNLNAFSGILDGNGYTITVPAGGKPLLGYVKGAEVRNLNIYGEKINGYGLVNNLEGVGLSGSAIIIENVTLKSGSSTLKSGLIGANITTNGFAGCSAGFTATIRNCTIERGVVVGYKKDQNMIGSIAGRMQGTVENCTSYATVYGTSYVGGIIGTRDNAMGLCSVTGCTFNGTVEASGEHAGGIIGGGYSNSTAPNGGIPLINNCSSAGNIIGANKVGGILGGDSYVAQLWGGWICQNNSFTGKVTATAGEYIGGIIGFLDSLNKWDGISNNYFAPECGTDKGIGFVQYVDTNCTDHETASGATYFNTENGTDDCPAVAGCGWKPALNRTDDPLGKDADKLATSQEMTDPVVTALAVSGEYRTQYYLGEDFDLTGMEFTATWSDGTSTNPQAEDITVTDYDSEKRGQQEVTLTYEGASAYVMVLVLKGAKVTFSLLGDVKHNSKEDGTIHTYAAENLETWVPETVYYVDLNSTVYDVMQIAEKEFGFIIDGDANNSYGTIYIRGITWNDLTLKELDNGPNSGWMYTINGIHPDVGVSAKYVEDGDAIVFHYTDDYTKEESLMFDKAQAAETEDAIMSLPEVSKLTSADKATVEAVRALYNALTDEQKALIPADKLKQLEAAEARIAELTHVHTWDAGTVTKMPTCTEKGVKTFKCSCGSVKTEAIPAVGHKYSTWAVGEKATVFALEKQQHTCSVCGHTETRYVGEKLAPVLEVPGKLTSLSIKKGKTAKFAVTMAEGDTLSACKSSKSSIVKVSSVDKKKGTVSLKALKSGTAKITISLSSGKSRVYTVKVTTGTVKTTKVTVSSKKVTLAKGKTMLLKTELKPFTSTQKVTYKSSNKKVATVTSSGKIKAIAPGTATITATSGTKKATCTVTVTGIANIKSSVTVKKNKTLTLKPKLYGITGKAVYTSSNTKVATVTANGKIKGIKKGTAVITVKAGNYSVKCKVTVK